MILKKLLLSFVLPTILCLCFIPINSNAKTKYQIAAPYIKKIEKIATYANTKSNQQYINLFKKYKIKYKTVYAYFRKFTCKKVTGHKKCTAKVIADKSKSYFKNIVFYKWSAKCTKNYYKAWSCLKLHPKYGKGQNAITVQVEKKYVSIGIDEWASDGGIYFTFYRHSNKVIWCPAL